MGLRRRFHGFVMRFSKRQEMEPRNGIEDLDALEHKQYNFDILRTATNDFSNSNKLGQGGFGSVYKGKLPNGQEIAVKRHSNNSAQGDIEFKNEVILGAKLYHRNLVRLLGFCQEGRERLIVYELVPNASLDLFLFDHVRRVHLDWKMRYKIICGVSKGLLYLHENIPLCMIHRNIKPGSVLLDTQMNPKISDFGMARLLTLDENEDNTSRIVGTYGYMAPEYAMHGQISDKIDVFSFGVLVLKILNGQKNTSFRNEESELDLLYYAWRDGTVLDLVDPVLRAESSSVPEMMRCIHVALLCVQEKAIDRPTMSTVVHILDCSSSSLPIPSTPAYFRHNTSSLNISSSAYSSENED